MNQSSSKVANNLNLSVPALNLDQFNHFATSQISEKSIKNNFASQWL